MAIRAPTIREFIDFFLSDPVALITGLVVGGAFGYFTAATVSKGAKETIKAQLSLSEKKERQAAEANEKNSEVLEQMRLRVRSLEAALEQAAKDKDQVLEESISETEDAANGFEEKIRSLELRLQQSKSENEKTKAELRKRVGVITSEVGEKKAQIARLNEQRESVLARVTELEAQILAWGLGPEDNISSKLDKVNGLISRTTADLSKEVGINALARGAFWDDNSCEVRISFVLGQDSKDVVCKVPGRRLIGREGLLTFRNGSTGIAISKMWGDFEGYECEPPIVKPRGAKKNSWLSVVFQFSDSRTAHLASTILKSVELPAYCPQL